MNVCRRGDVVDQELAGGVGKSVNLVAVVNLVVFLRPPGVNILLALLGRLIIPQLAAPALLDELISLTRMALLGGLNERAVEDHGARVAEQALLAKLLEVRVRD